MNGGTTPRPAPPAETPAPLALAEARAADMCEADCGVLEEALEQLMLRSPRAYCVLDGGAVPELGAEEVGVDGVVANAGEGEGEGENQHEVEVDAEVEMVLTGGGQRRSTEGAGAGAGGG